MRALRAARISMLAYERPLLIRPSTLARPLLVASPIASTSSRLLHTSPSAQAKKGKAGKSKPIDAEGIEEEGEDAKVKEAVDKTRGKMSKAVEWAKSQVYDGVERARGRVSPSLLDNVKVSLPDDPALIPLLQVASVTMKQNALLVEVWDATASKHVESAIHKANLPGISPQRTGDNTFKIPVSRPTVEQRAQISKSFSATIESAKQQVRGARNDGMKQLGGRGVAGTSEVQELADQYGAELDEMLVKAKRELEK